jgi:hypothetical protein
MRDAGLSVSGVSGDQGLTQWCAGRRLDQDGMGGRSKEGLWKEFGAMEYNRQTA